MNKKKVPFKAKMAWGADEGVLRYDKDREEKIKEEKEF
jgi:hypothetical protein